MEKKKVFNKDEGMNLKDIIKCMKIVSIIGIIVNLIISVVIIFMSSFITLNVVNGSTESLLKNDFIINYIAKVNCYSISDIKDLIINMTSQVGFITLDVIIPSLIVLIILIIMVIFCFYIVDFIRGVESDKTLFTEEKLRKLKKVESLLLLASVLLILAFDISYFILCLILEIALEFVLYLFNYCVKNENERLN